MDIQKIVDELGNRIGQETVKVVVLTTQVEELQEQLSKNVSELEKKVKELEEANATLTKKLSNYIETGVYHNPDDDIVES